MSASHRLTDNERLVQDERSISTQFLSIPTATELCPPHWRLPRKQTIRTKLRALIAHTSRKSPPVVQFSPQRPAMRFKDSDDYLTERAANPRTGQISPSIGSSPRTPDNPGAALKAHATQLIRGSPSPTKRQGGIRLANEGKKVQDSATASFLAAGGMVRGTDSCDLILPTMLTKHVPPKVFKNITEHSTSPEDRFVVNMPSAREPQPYTFPGSNGNQIQAFEHYKRKANRTSGDGYDRRLLADSRNVSDDYSREVAHSSATQHHQHYDAASPSSKQLRERADVTHSTVAPLNIVKRRQATTEIAAATIIQGRTMAFAPERSPQFQKYAPFEQFAAIRSTPGAYRNFSPEGLSTVLSSSLEEDAYVGEAEAQGQPCIDSSAMTLQGVAHLNQLPRVHLVHPSLAATPSSPANEVRSCSLGCSRNTSNNTCVESRKTSLQSEVDRFSLFANDDHLKSQRLTQQPKATLELMEIIMLAVSILWQWFKDSLVAHTSALSRLFPQDLTTWEKLMILKSLFCLFVKITAVFIVITLIWKLTGIALQMLRLVFWPLDVIVRTARWVVPAA